MSLRHLIGLLPLALLVARADEFAPHPCPVTNAVADVLTPLPLGTARLGGPIGEVLDRVVAARITSAFARDAILAEAEEAFRRRVDDRMRPGQGQWQGEFWGKWMLSALAAQRYTGDSALQETIARSVDALLQTQRADGYIGTYANSAFVCSPNGKANNWNVWCRKYTLWALLEAGELRGDTRTLDATKKFMDQLMTEVGPGRIEIGDTGMFKGLPSTSLLGPVVLLYRETGDARYLDYAEYIVRQWSSHAGQPPDLLRKGLSGQPIHAWFPEPEKWTKAYELISCVEGLVELHRVTGNAAYRQAAINLHRVIREWERSIFGGVGKNDKLLGSRFLAETEAEVCDAVYWQRLSAQLLRLTGEPAYAEDIERTAFNDLCAAMKTDGSWGVRRLCLSGEHWPAPQHCGLTNQHCCVANHPRGMLQLAQVAVMTARDGVAVNLFIPGEYRGQLAGGGSVKLNVDAELPVRSAVQVQLGLAKPERFTLRLRMPPWATKATLSINDKPVPAAAPGAYAIMEREWRAGDRIAVRFDMSARVVPFPARPDGAGPTPALVAVEYGPLVLARDIRLGADNIRAPVTLDTAADGTLAVRRVEAPAGFRYVFEVPVRTPAGRRWIRMCDFASAGATWKKETSDFLVWLPR